MNKIKNEKNGAATAVVEPKRYEEAFKHQSVEHWLRSGKSATQIAKEMGIIYPSPKEGKSGGRQMGEPVIAASSMPVATSVPSSLVPSSSPA